MPPGERPATTARGVHHTAHISSDVARTIEFYQGLLGFPLTELFENRDYPGSTHFFFDIGGGNALAFFDFPGLDVGPYAEVLGGHHHLAISVEPASGSSCASASTLPASSTSMSAACRCTSAAPTASASSCCPTRSGRCTGTHPVTDPAAGRRSGPASTTSTPRSVHLLAERFKITQAVGRYKAEVGLPPADPDRERQQIARLRALAEESGLDPAFTEKFLRFIVDEVILHHKRIADGA